MTNHLDYLTADREETYIVAQANAPIDEKGNFLAERVTCRCKGDFIDVEPARWITWMSRPSNWFPWPRA